MSDMSIEAVAARLEDELKQQARDDDYDAPYVAEGWKPGTLQVDGQVRLADLARAALGAVSCRDSFTGGWITRGIVDGEQERENQSGGGDRA